jgi:type I restriction enzyme S subunit
VCFVPFRAFVFQPAIRKFEQLRAQQREAQRQVEHLFQTLLHRAFREEL